MELVDVEGKSFLIQSYAATKAREGGLGRGVASVGDACMQKAGAAAADAAGARNGAGTRTIAFTCLIHCSASHDFDH